MSSPAAQPDKAQLRAFAAEAVSKLAIVFLGAGYIVVIMPDDVAKHKSWSKFIMFKVVR